MADAQATKVAPADKKARHRSPNYPAIGLRAAIEKVRLLYDADKRAGAPVDAALRHMGFSTKHGQALAVLSAVKKYGLVEESSGRIVQRSVPSICSIFQIRMPGRYELFGMRLWVQRFTENCMSNTNPQAFLPRRPFAQNL